MLRTANERTFKNTAHCPPCAIYIVLAVVINLIQNNMTTQTKKFIIGLLGTLLCCVGVAIHIADMQQGAWECSWFNIFMLCGSALGVISFGMTLSDSIR